MQNMKIGELAKQTGLSVRTLHHYDEINLLRPSGRSEGDHRIYGAQDIERLHQIISLKKLNLSLEEITATLKSGPTLLSVLERHRDLLEEELNEKRKIFERLQATLEFTKFNGAPSTENLLESIREITIFEKMCTKNQIDEVLAVSQSMGQDKTQESVEELMALVKEFKIEMIKATPANDPKILNLTKRWIDIRNSFTKGKFEVSEEARQTLLNDSSIEQRYGINKELMAYIQKSADAIKQT